MNIFLIGYMASGKSTVGKLLASKLGYAFLDLDAYIEKKEKKTIPSIFSKKGEVYFRKKETVYLAEILKNIDQTIVALGGGTPCYGQNMKLLNETNNVKTVYLKLSISELTQRLMEEKDSRPLLTHLKTEPEMTEFIGKHLFERQHFYNQSDIVIDLAGKTTEEAVEAIVVSLF